MADVFCRAHVKWMNNSQQEIPTDKVCVFGLEVLRQQGLIALHHDPAVSASQRCAC
jgi:hypothetical protein